jgi:putative transposase
MLAKLSTRRYPAGLEPVGADVERAAAGTSKWAVSCRFVARTEPSRSPRTCPPWIWWR